MKVILNSIVKIQDRLGKVIAQNGSMCDILIMDLETFDLEKKMGISSHELEVLENGKETSFEDYFDSNDFDAFIQDLIFSHENGQTDKLMSHILHNAVAKDTFIFDLNEVDYDKILYSFIKDY